MVVLKVDQRSRHISFKRHYDYDQVDERRNSYYQVSFEVTPVAYTALATATRTLKCSQVHQYQYQYIYTYNL